MYRTKSQCVLINACTHTPISELAGAPAPHSRSQRRGIRGDNDIRARTPNLRRRLAIVAQAQHVLPGWQITRHRHAIVYGDVRRPFAGTSSAGQPRGQGRLEARRVELECALGLVAPGEWIPCARYRQHLSRRDQRQGAVRHEQ